MKNLRKIFPIAICSFLVGGGAFVMAKGLHKDVTNFAKADGISVSLTLGASNGKIGFYANAPENSLPFSDDWNTRYYPKTADSIKVNGVGVADPYDSSIEHHDWEESIVKTGAGDYYFALGGIDSKFTAGDNLTFGGLWVGRYNDVDYEFTVTDFAVVWSGGAFIESVPESDLEPFDVLTLRDLGIFEHEKEKFDTEEGGCVAYNSWSPCTGNNHSNFEFAFIFETYTSEAMPEFTLRIGANPSWTAGHYFESKFGIDWGPSGVFYIKEFNGSNLLWSGGDVNLNLKNSTNKIAIGNIHLVNEAKQYTYVKVNDVLVLGKIHDAYDDVAFLPRVGIYNVSTLCSIRNAWAANYNGQTVKKHNNSSSASGLYFQLDPNDGYYNPAGGDPAWAVRYYPLERTNFLLNGQPFVAYKQNLLVKFAETQYYIAFGDWGYASLMTEGAVFTIKGEFRYILDGTYYSVYINQRSFRFNGETWDFYDISDLEDSSFDNLQPTDLLRNLGRMKPDHSGSAVKEFDQKITWDAENQQEVDTLVYKKDANGNTGIYFTNNNSATHGEFRVYLPDNGYKTETKGYALTKLTFDYILKDSGVETAQGRNHGLDENGFFTPAPQPVTSKFLVQAMCKYSDPSNMYFDIEVELLNDGLLHSCTVNVPYADICGFCFVVWNFDGTFFMSNCHADFLDYDQALNNFVTQSLKMYSYTGSNQCGDYYGAAKTAYEALTADERALFGTHAAYGSARARLTAWAAANGETFDASAGTFTPHASGLGMMNIANNNYAVIIIVASVIATISLAGMFLIIRRRKMIRK